MPDVEQWPRFCPRCGRGKFEKQVYVGESWKNETVTHFYGPHYSCGTTFWPSMKAASYSEERCPECKS